MLRYVKMSKKIFLKRYLQQAIPCSAQEAINIIESSRVRIDGKTCKRPQMLVFSNYTITLDDKELVFCDVPLLYYVFNKPSGVLCQKDAEKKNVFDYIDMLDIDEKTKSTMFNVGRLDLDTEGLLIVTNDGSFAKRVISPEYKVPKTYTALVAPHIRQSSIANLRRGVNIPIDGKGSYKTAPAQIELIEHSSAKDSVVRVIITEGKKRQIRKMFANQGYKVLQLKRVAIGGLSLGKIRPGKIVEFKKEELINLIYNKE